MPKGPRRRLRAPLLLALASGLALGSGTSPARSDEAPSRGTILAPIAVDDCGEMELRGDEVVYRPWQAGEQPTLLHFVPARRGVAHLNGAALEAVVDARPGVKPNLVTLLNAKDALWGTGRFIKGWAENNKREIPQARLVLDCVGKVREAWNLPRKTSVLMLIDSERRLHFYHSNEATEESQRSLLHAIDALMPEAALPARSEMRPIRAPEVPRAPEAP